MAQQPTFDPSKPSKLLSAGPTFDPSKESSVVPDAPSPPLGPTRTAIGEHLVQNYPAVLGGPMAGEIGLGAVKSIPRVVLELSQWLSQLTGFGDPDKFQAVQDRLAPQSDLESAGGVVGEVVQSVLPSGIITKGGKAVQGAIRGAQAVPSLARRGAAIMGRGAVEGGAQAAIAAAQENDPLVAGAFGSAAPVVGAMASHAVPALRESAEQAMVRAMGPAGRQGPGAIADLATAERVAPQLLDRGFSAVGHGSALKQVGEKISAANQQLDQIMASLPPNTRVPLQPIIDFLESGKDAGRVMGVDVGSGEVKNDVLQLVIQKMKEIASQTKSRTASPEDIVKLRRLYGPMAQWSKMAANSENMKAEAYQTAYNGIRESLDQVDSAIGPANKEISFWLNVKGLLEKADARPTSGLAGTTGALAAGAAQAAASGGAGSVVLAGVAGRQLQRLLRSPGYRFVSAQAKDKLAEALTGGDVSKISAMLGSLISQATASRPMASHVTPDAALVKKGAD